MNSSLKNWASIRGRAAIEKCFARREFAFRRRHAAWRAGEFTITVMRLRKDSAGEIRELRELWETHEHASPSLVTEVRIAAGAENIGFSFGYQRNAGESRIARRRRDRKVFVHHAAAEVGQGTHTVLAQMAANAVSGVSMSSPNDCSDTATPKARAGVRIAHDVHGRQCNQRRV